MNISKILEQKNIEVSVPCRIDLGGTLDISTFYLSMNHLECDHQMLLPSSFNIALDLYTVVTLSGYKKGYIKISSKGFKSAVFHKDEVLLLLPLLLHFLKLWESPLFLNRLHGLHTILKLVLQACRAACRISLQQLLVV